MRPRHTSPLQRRRERSVANPWRCNTPILSPFICARIAHSSLFSWLSHTALASYGLDGNKDHGACVGLTSCVVCGACACGCRSVVCVCVALCTWLGWCWVASPRRSVPLRFIVQPRHRRMGHEGRDEHVWKCVRPLRISHLQRRRERPMPMLHDYSFLSPLICVCIAHSSLFSRLSHTALASYGMSMARETTVRVLA